MKEYGSYIDTSALEAPTRNPWETLTAFGPTENQIFSSLVRPLTASEIFRVKDNLVDPSHLPELEQVCAQSEALFDASNTIAIVLDGRSDYSNQGWLGDMTEASRLVQPLLEAGKDVVIITSHPDLFAPTPGVTTVGIPSEVSSKALHPYNEALLKFCAGKADAFLFPISIYLPVLLEIGEDGTLANRETVENFRLAIDPSGKNKGIPLKRWTDQGVHQLQALQVLSTMIGMKDAYNWDNIPPAYIHPDENSEMIAREVIRLCQKHETEQVSPTAFPIFIHIGSATDHNKNSEKFYPEDKWTEFLTLLAQESSNISEVFFFRPTDPEQLLVTERLVAHARKLGLNAIEIPLEEIQRQYGWTLGAFAQFLKYIHDENGFMVGVDSLPAAHLAPAIGIPSIVLGNGVFDQSFFGPCNDDIIVMPTDGAYTSGIEPSNAVTAVTLMAKKRTRRE